MANALRLVVAAILSFPVVCGASTGTWEALDYKSCKQWTITTDYSEIGEEFEKANKLLQRLNRAAPREDWHFLEAYGSEAGDRQYGVCAYMGNTFTCHEGTAFPLAGATFVDDSEKMAARCVRGCEKLPFNIMYQRGYEDGEDSKELAPALNKFKAACRQQKGRRAS